jgi:hypothetical protein
MPGPAEVSELRLELRDFRAVDKLAMVEHPGNRLIDGLAEPATLRGKVDEGYGFGTQVLVHGALQGLRRGHLRVVALHLIMVAPGIAG